MKPKDQKATLQVKPGHSNSSTIFVLTKAKDKAQMFHISGKAAEEVKKGKSPRMICEKAMKDMQGDI